MAALPARNYGWWTPAGWGGIKLGETPGGTITGTGAADFSINASGALVGSGTFSLSAPVTKTSGVSVWSKAIGQTYNLTLPSGDTIDITLTNDTHVTEYGGTVATDEWVKYWGAGRDVAAFANPVLRPNVTRAIILRDGSYFNSSPTNVYDFRVPNGGWPGAVSITTAGSGYAGPSPSDGVQDVPIVAVTGVGTGALANIVVVGGLVVQVFITNPGTGYQAGDVVNAPSLAGGFGFTGTVVDMAARLLSRSETATPGNDADGNPIRGGGAKSGGVGITGRFWALPADFKWITFYYNGANTGRMAFLGHRNATGEWGYGSYENRFENGPLVAVAQRNYAMSLRGGVAKDNHIENVQRGISQTGFDNTFAVLTTIQNNIFKYCSDCMTLSTQNFLIEDNFGFNPLTKIGDHPDFIQHTGEIGTVTAGSGYTPGTHTNVPLVAAGAVNVVATITVGSGGGVNVNGGCIFTNWTTAPSGVVYTVDPSYSGLGPGSNFSFRSGYSVPYFGIIRRNIAVRNVAPNKDATYEGADWQMIFLSDSRPPPFISGLTCYNNIGLCTQPNAWNVSRFRNSSVSWSTHLNQLNTNAAGTGATHQQGVMQPSTPSGPENYNDTIIIDRCVSNLITNFTDKSTCREISITSPDIPADIAAYQLAFPGYISGSNPGYVTVAAVKAAVTPAVLDAASGGMRLLDGTYAGALFPDGTWNDGTVYQATPATTVMATVDAPSTTTNSPVNVNFQLDAVASSTTTITPHLSGVTGSFSPTTCVIAIGQAGGSVAFTPTSVGTATITTTNDRGLSNLYAPDPLVVMVTAPTNVPTLFTQTALPATVGLGAQIVITYTLDQVATQDVTITPGATGAAGSFTTPTVVIPLGSQSGVVRYNTAAIGVVTFSATNNRSLTNPGNAQVTVSALRRSLFMRLGFGRG